MKADYIVIGGGAAGCVMAARLSESGRRVLLLEAGGPFPGGTQNVPLLSLYGSLRYSRWSFRTEQQEGLHHRQMILPMGRTLGGSSAINAMIYTRGDRSCYDGWEQAGNPGWGFASVLPYFRKAEDFEGGASEYHGQGGCISVSRLRCVAPFSHAFVEAGQELAFPYREDFNGPAQLGVGLYHVTQRLGVRVSSFAYLRRARRRKNLTVVTDAQVLRLVFEGDRAVAVELLRGDRLEYARAEAEVILCCGALISPKLLMLSGVGPAKHLRELGLEVRVDLPGVGENLQDHLRLPVQFRSRRQPPLRPVQQPDDVVPAAWAYWRYRLLRRGPLTSNLCEAGGFLPLDQQPRSQAPLQFVTHWEDPLDLEPCLVGTRSRGQLRLRSRDPRDPPAIDPRYLSEPADVAVLADGIQLSRELAHTRTLQDFGVEAEVAPGPEIQTPRQLERYIRNAVRTCFHPVGTCKMAPETDPLGVVDARLRVRGLANVRVVDASIMPDIVNANTCAPTIMIGERAADLVLGSC